MKAAQKAIPKIPDGMVELMKNLVKSVLKEQPENIYLFAAEYFENLVLKRDGSLDKEYSVFRRYEEELERRRDKEGCSRCRHLVNVEGNADDDLTKQADDEHSLDMSVSGVAIKAIPRHYKPFKSQKSKQQLETIRSESMDSAIEDDGKSISTKSHDNKNPVEPMIAVNEEQIVPMEKIPTEKIVQPLIEEIIEPITARALMSDEDVPPDTPTNETSISDANTDRTVIEIAASTLTIDNKNDESNPLESDTEENNSIDIKPIDTSTEIQLLTESPKSELLNLQKSDRIRTPESDSGLSEKSFNLNIHEEMTANEMYKAEPIKEEDFIEEKVIPVATSKSSEMTKEDDGKMNRSDVEQLESDINETEQIQTNDRENENREERKDEIEKVRSIKQRKPTNDQFSSDSQEIIAGDIFEKIKDPNNIVSKEEKWEKTELTGSKSSEKHETNLKDKPLAESNDSEKKKIEKEPRSIEKGKTIEYDQSADSTEKPAIAIEIKTDEQIPNQEETDTSSNDMKLIEENEELPKTTENEIIYLQSKTVSDNDKMIEFNGQKPIDAILETETSEINKTSSENVKVNESTEGKPTEFEEMTDSQAIIDEHYENNPEGVEMAESNEKESTVTESTSNDTESPNIIHDTKNIDVLSGEEIGKTKSNKRSNSEDQVDSKWEITKDSIVQKVQEQDGNQVELHINQLTDNQSPEIIQCPNQGLELSDSNANNSEECGDKLNSGELKPNQPSEEANIINKANDGLNGDEFVKNMKNIDENQPMKENSVNNDTNESIAELKNVEKEDTGNEVVPLNLDSEETLISNELKDVEKEIDGIREADSPKKARSNEASLEAGKHTQSESVPTSPKVQSNESELEIDEKHLEQLKTPPTTPKIEINGSALEIGEKHSEELNSLPITPKAESNESETVEQQQSKSTPPSPKTEIDRTEPILDTECEKHSNETESNDQKLSKEISTLIENEPTDSNETTIIEQNLQSTTIENNKLSTTNENQTEDIDTSINSPNTGRKHTAEVPRTNEIETTHLDIKNNNDDAMSEISSAVKDDLYEKAETEIIGDESVQDLDLSMQENEQTEDVSKEDLTRPNTAKQQTNLPQQQDLNKNDNRIQPDSLDNSLEPRGENDSLCDTKSVDSLEVKKEIAKSDKDDVITSSLEPNEKNLAHSHIDQDLIPNKSTKTDDKRKDQEESVTSTLLVESKPDSFSHDLMGDSVNDKGNYDHMNDQMKNEMATLNFNQNVTPIQLSNIEEVDTPVTPKPAGNKIKFIYESELNVQDDIKLDNLTKESKENPYIKIETIVYSETESKESMSTKSDGEVILQTQPDNQENPNKNNSNTKSQNNVKTVDFLTSLRHISHDTPSSDLSDTDTEKPELVSNESCIDENSRDDHDDVSEVENFDLSSCGEDSLEAMYYMLRKNEILMDEQKKMNKCEDEKITFPEKATENLENFFHEVSGKKTCSVGSRNNSSTDELILKQISSDSDALQMRVLPNSEIDSSTEPRSCAMNTTDDEYLTEKNDTSAHGMVSNETESKIKQTNNSLTNDEQPPNECDSFDNNVNQANIKRRIQAYSIFEANSDETPVNTRILTMNDFNVSTALGHLRSTAEESFESAATKIQAVAKGFLTRRRLKRSNHQKSSSIGNAAIDKSLNNVVDRQQLIQDQHITKIDDDDDLRPILTNNQTIESIDDNASLRGIIEVKMEQKKNDASSSIIINENITEISTYIETELTETGSDDSGTAQRRLTLQRGDAMQRNSTLELERQQLLNDTENIDNKEPTNDEAPASPKQDEVTTESIHKPVKSASKLPTGKPMKTLGPRQRSMPVQFESMLMRVLPMPEQKRNKSANSSTPKKTNRKPNLF